MKYLLLLLLTFAPSTLLAQQYCPNGTCPARPMVTEEYVVPNSPVVDRRVYDMELKPEIHQAPAPIQEYTPPVISDPVGSPVTGSIRDFFRPSPEPESPAQPDVPETPEVKPEDTDLQQGLFDRFKGEQDEVIQAMARERQSMFSKIRDMRTEAEARDKAQRAAAAKRFKLLQTLREQNKALEARLLDQNQVLETRLAEQTEIQKGIFQRWREAREERGPLLEGVKPIQNLLKRGTTVVWLLGGFLASLIIVVGIFILVLVNCYRRLQKQISDLI